MFISDEKVRVSIDGQDAIYILPKMNVGVKNKTLSAIAKISANTMALVAGGGGDTESVGQEINMDMGAYNTALLINNIVSWEGPSFTDVKCTRENILKLDPDNPLVDKVLAEINERNTKKGTPDPEVSATAGSSDLTAS